MEIQLDVGYLVKFIKPNKKYPVSYVKLQDGTTKYGHTTLLGKDLTENQIAQLFKARLV